MRSYDIVKKTQDLTHLTWDERAVTSGTGGVFLKARQRTSRGNVYYKLSNYDSYKGVFGHESVNELIASRLLDALEIPHVPYKLIHANIVVNGTPIETWLSESRDYRKANERKQPLDSFYELREIDRSIPPLDFCIERGCSETIYKMMAFDYLIINRDRHGANIEVVFSDGVPKLAPLFDHGLSLVCSCYDDESDIKKFDSLRDIKVHNYLGSRSLEDNLERIPKKLFDSSQLSEQICDDILENLDDVLSATHLEKIREILLLRWMHLIDMGIAG